MNEHYDRRTVWAPAWMKDFQCLAGDCPEVCCQQWNVDVDPAHAESLRHIPDPELQELMDRVLRSAVIRRPGSRKADRIHRLQLLSQPDRRCPLLNERNECRLHKKFGPYILCDTCYFHPKTFFQIDEQTVLSACLSCPECVRLALTREEPVAFTHFETEIDPNAEWLETELIASPDARHLLREREVLIRQLCTLLQDRSDPIERRLKKLIDLLAKKAAGPDRDPDPFPQLPDFSAPEEWMEQYIAVFHPVSEAIEKPAQAAARSLQELAGGTDGFAALLAQHYRQGAALYEPFRLAHPALEENFLVHCVFSDSCKQFYRYQNEPLTAAQILRHEAALLIAWYWYFRVLMAQTALINGRMDPELLTQTISRADKCYWHYPDWFNRCADRI